MKVFLSFFAIFLTILLKAQPPGCSSTNDVSGAAGQAGLYGEYFAGYHNESPSFYPNTVSATNRIETTLNYTTNNWGAIVPPGGGTVADADYYSSRYTGSIYIATAGVYTFYLTSDDGSYMWIDNDAISYPTVVANAFINNGGGHGDVTVTNSANLSVGFHNIQIQFGEMAGGNHLILEYSATSPSITRQVIPSSVLCTGIQPAIAAPVIPPPPGCTCYAGVIGQFYNGYFNDDQTYFSTNTNVINRLDANIGFATDGGWGNVCPPLAGSNASPETYSARFSGQIYVPTADTYTFYLTGDDGVWMWIGSSALATNPTNATAFINNGGLHSANMVSASVALTAGLHDFKIHYGENTGNNVCVLEYASSTITRQTIPQSAFCSCMSTINLPVELLSFNANVVSDKKVALNWKTATEKNNMKFDIERSSDAINFKPLSVVATKAEKGNSLVALSYDYMDNDPLGGISYYRLKQTDFDETFKYHKIVSVDLNKVNHIMFSAYPNPSNGQFVLKLKGAQKNQTIETKIYSIDGRLVFNKTFEVNVEDGEPVIFKTDNAFEPGIYIANCVVNGISYPVKIVVN